MTESDFKFLGYKISRIDFELKDTFGKVQEIIKPGIEVIQNYNPEDPRFVEVVLQIKVKFESDSAYFNITIKGGFQASKEMSDELFTTMANQNAPAILYPFARAIMASYTAQASIPPILLPTVNFTKPLS